ncbi:hypothetical protein [Blastococcus sp. VKM Ac-2987]|uniref:hypothetical protein n=1 Tax=Blastococcus sp. VKM Ac-2987 TaxID=3004141 RepID=UPI0022AB7E78|nr:hypothetical protein [Blastococcus sp. VKM Ac-2987]MCZ2861206.1 hypothetical protein [Blastococcus sp. VKM Ac-2987]
MAGGMHRGRGGRSLGERAAESGVGAQLPRPPLPEPPLPEPPPLTAAPGRPVGGSTGAGRHCWVHDPPEAPGTWPGLLVEWQQRDGGWQGRVTYALPGPHGAALVETWLPASRLEPR